MNSKQTTSTKKSEPCELSKIHLTSVPPFNTVGRVPRLIQEPAASAEFPRALITSTQDLRDWVDSISVPLAQIIPSLDRLGRKPRVIRRDRFVRRQNRSAGGTGGRRRRMWSEGVARRERTGIRFRRKKESNRRSNTLWSAQWLFTVSTPRPTMPARSAVSFCRLSSVAHVYWVSQVKGSR